MLDVSASNASAFPWFLANAFDAHDVGQAVPLACVKRPRASFSVRSVRALGRACADQELIGALVGRSVTAKSTAWPMSRVMLGSNHRSGLKAWAFVDKAIAGYREAQHVHAFPVEASPPVYPATFSPTGAVPKKLRDGSIDPENMRPTADYSWPPPGHWMKWLYTSINEGIDLDNSFPYIRYLSHKDISRQILRLKIWGEPVV